MKTSKRHMTQGERKMARKQKRKFKDALSLSAFPVEKIPQEKEVFAPEKRQAGKLYATIATNVWRIKNQILDLQSGETKEELSSREITKIARYLESMASALADAGVQTVGDYEGRAYDVGDPVKVIAWEERDGLKREEYLETLLPTVRWTDASGKTDLLQQAEVVAGRPIKKEEENEQKHD